MKLMNKESVAATVKTDALMIEGALEAMLSASEYCADLTDAMRYSVLGGGKRIRGVICLEVCKMLGGDAEKALPFACALELMHASSLVHDDMPELDNDDMRRGKPSCHKKYGQTTALLCGDALMCLAFEALTSTEGGCVRKAVRELADAGGRGGICSGQMLDVASENADITYEELLRLQSLKTGRLMKASAVLGALCAKAEKTDIENCAAYAQNLGLAFQIVDDLLDAEEEGSDAKRGLTTFLTFMNADDARAEAARLSEGAKRAISAYGDNGFLTGLCDYLLERTY